MKIPRSILTRYIDSVVSEIIACHDYALDDSSDFEQSIFDGLNLWLRANNHHDIFLAGIDYLLNSPDIDTRAFQNNEYPWTDAEMRRVIKEIRKRLWPDQPMTPEVILKNIELTND